MSQQTAKQDTIIVGTATIAADLHRIMHIAWTVSLAARNARIISAQAGKKARGFQPITSYIDEITQFTLDSTGKVEQESVRLTRFASRHLRTLDINQRYLKIFKTAGAAVHIASLRPAADQCDKRLSKGQHALDGHLKTLQSYLEDLNENMRAALAVAAICRIEASRAGEFRDNLSVVSDNLDKAAHTIQDLVHNGLKRIEAIQDKTRNPTGQIL